MYDDWRLRALCRDDPDMWWEEELATVALHQCLVHCPVRWECREAAIREKPSGCVMGGLVWVAAGKGRTSGKPGIYRSKPIACADCRKRVDQPCGYCGEGDASAYGDDPLVMSHSECREDYRLTASEII